MGINVVRFALMVTFTFVSTRYTINNISDIETAYLIGIGTGVFGLMLIVIKGN